MVAVVFDCVDVYPDRYAASPTMLFKIRLFETTGAKIHQVAIRCQMRIEPQKRMYTDVEKTALYDLFGEHSQWGDTLKPFQLCNVSHMVGGFTGSIEFDMPVPFTYDLEVAAGRYFDALADGDIPILLLFSGTIFVATETGFQIEPVPWDKEANLRMPAKVWREMIDLYFPGQGWLRLNRETIESLRRFKNVRGLSTWDIVVEALLKEAGE
ncbi:MAG: DUF6084 family protein [Actinobacteria bacterium]|nr:DUF6084 family protein [Actinomycetota bacterium]